MKRIIFVALVLVFLATAAQAAVCTLVRVGGADVDFPPGEGAPPDNDANLSLIAMVHCDGTVQGQFHDSLFRGVGVHADVTCVEVEGNDAWVSGIIKHVTPESTFDGDFDGVPIRIRFRDNGISANDPPDQASFWSFTDSPDDCMLRPDDELYDMNNGQVQIKE